MTIKTLIATAAAAIGMFGIADRADAQWRYRSVYRYPTYSYSNPAYTYSYPTYSSSSYYSSPGYYTSPSGVVTASYATPYSTSYYSTPYTTSYFNTPYSSSYYNGYSNLYGSPYGVGVGTRGGMFYGRRAWRY